MDKNTKGSGRFESHVYGVPVKMDKADIRKVQPTKPKKQVKKGDN